MFALLAVAAVSVWQAHEQANAIEDNAEEQARIAELNARLAEMDAAEAYREGQAEQARFAGEATKASDQQTAFFAQAGVDTTQAGAAADIVQESKLNIALNKQDLEKQALQTSEKFKREASATREQAALNREASSRQAQSTLISGYAGAIGAGAKAYGTYAGRAKAKKDGEV